MGGDLLQGPQSIRELGMLVSMISLKSSSDALHR